MYQGSDVKIPQRHNKRSAPQSINRNQNKSPKICLLMLVKNHMLWTTPPMSLYIRGGSRISGKGFICIKVCGVRFADFISFFLNIPWKWKNLVLRRPNYFIFIGYLKTGGGRGIRANPLKHPLDRPLYIYRKCYQIEVSSYLTKTV